MKECKISANSTCEQVAEDLFMNLKLKEEDKKIFIKEGISGDILYMLDIDHIKKELKFKPILANKIKKYLEENKEKFKPKEISENIPIKNEEEIKAFFEKFIGYKDNLDSIKGENDLRQLKTEDMVKLGLNLGQRIKLVRYINYFNSLKEKKEIKITITKDSNDVDALNYLKNELNISQESIEKIGLDSDIANTLFDSEVLTENVLNEYLESKDIKQDEYDSLMKFIKLRDEMEENEKNEVKRKCKSIESDKIEYLKKDIEPFQKNSDYNIFFILSTKNETFSNLRFAVFQTRGFISSKYINRYFYLINSSSYKYKEQNFFMLLFQVILDNPIHSFCVNVIDQDKNPNSPIYESEEIIMEKEFDNNFVLSIEKINKDFFPPTPNDIIFTEYLNYFFDEKNEKKMIKKNLIEILNMSIANHKKTIFLSGKNILKFIKNCIDLNISPISFESIKLLENEKTLDKKYYISDDLIRNNFQAKERIMINTIMLKIFAKFDVNKLLEMINDPEICKIFFDLINYPPLQIKFDDIKQKMNNEQIKELQNKLLRIIKGTKDIKNIIRMGNGLESSLEFIKDNMKKIIEIIDNEKSQFNGLQLNDPMVNDDIEKVSKYYNAIDADFKSFNRQYSLLNKKYILEKMVDIYKNKDKIEEYILLKNILEKDKNVDTKIIQDYRDNIHNKGKSLIEKGKMTNKQIIKFIKEQDYYYSFDKPFIYDRKKRDAKIFSFIGITSKCPDFKENIKLIKDNELYKLYDKSTPELKDFFYKEILKQMETFNDMESIFETFPQSYIKGRFLLFINRKFKELLNLIIENNCDISYSVIDQWLKVNYEAGLLNELGEIIIELNKLNKFNLFTSHYYI